MEGGTFFRSYEDVLDDPDPSADPTKSYPATVSDFSLDKYEVTVGRFRMFVQAVKQGWLPAQGLGARTLNGSDGQGGWDYDDAADTWPDISTTLSDANLTSCDVPNWTPAVSANEYLPMNCISWFEAFAFCGWDGGFLPTETELNYALAGGDEGRPYAWSTKTTEIDDTYVVGCFTTPCGYSEPVGSKQKGNGRWGQADLTGNVWELALDTFEGTDTPVSYPNTSCVDCAVLGAAADLHAARGSSFFNILPFGLRTVWRGTGLLRGQYTGVRCARTP